jgi:hypothetical protein
MRLRARKARPSVQGAVWGSRLETNDWYVPWRIECIRRLSRLSAQPRFCLPRAIHSQDQEQRRVACVRAPIHRPSMVSGITAGTMSGPSGREAAAITIRRRMARPWSKRPNPPRATSVTPIPMTCPGIGRIAIRRTLSRPTGPTCRAAPRSPSRFPDVMVIRPSTSRGAIDFRRPGLEPGPITTGFRG